MSVMHLSGTGKILNPIRIRQRMKHRQRRRKRQLNIRHIGEWTLLADGMKPAIDLESASLKIDS
jgi:hypothetical protein